MKKFLAYLFLLGAVVGNVWAGEVEPVVLARMAFTNAKDNSGQNVPGIVLELEEENIEPETKTILVTKEVGSGKRKRKQQVEDDVALDAYRAILAPLIQNDTIITINKATINACKDNLSDPKKSDAITKYFADEKPGTVIKNLNAALDTFYKKISDNFFVKERGIDFASIGTGASESESKQQTYSPVLNSFFTALQSISNETFENFVLNKTQPTQPKEKNPFAPVRNPFSSEYFNKDNVIADFEKLMKLLNTRCATSSASAVIDMMPFINLYNRENMRTNSLRYVYNALMELGFAFKFEMESISLPGLQQRAANYAQKRFFQWLQGNQPAKK
jgi:hypothetical protein